MQTPCLPAFCPFALYIPFPRSSSSSLHCCLLIPYTGVPLYLVDSLVLYPEIDLVPFYPIPTTIPCACLPLPTYLPPISSPLGVREGEGSGGFLPRPRPLPVGGMGEGPCCPHFPLYSTFLPYLVTPASLPYHPSFPLTLLFILPLFFPGAVGQLCPTIYLYYYPFTLIPLPWSLFSLPALACWWDALTPLVPCLLYLTLVMCGHMPWVVPDLPNSCSPPLAPTHTGTRDMPPTFFLWGMV